MSAATPLGPFAAERGRAHPLAVAAGILAAAAVAAALWRPLVRAIAGRDPMWATTGSVVAGVAAATLALAALWLAATRGAGGERLARVAFGAGVAAALGGFVAGAIADGTLRLDRFFEQYFDTDILARLPGDFGRGVVNTLQLAFVSEILAIVVGLLVATAVMSPRWWLRYPAVAYVDVVRGLPLVVTTFLINFGLPNVGVTLGEFASPVTILTVNASAYIAEIFRAGIQSVPRGQTDAARSLGMPHATAMTRVVLPQAARAVIPPLVSEFIALVKDTAIVLALIGFTTATRDVFGAASQAAASTFSPTPYVAAGFVYLAITIPLARLAGRLERRVRTGLA